MTSRYCRRVRRVRDGPVSTRVPGVVNHPLMTLTSYSLVLTHITVGTLSHSVHSTLNFHPLLGLVPDLLRKSLSPSGLHLLTSRSHFPSLSLPLVSSFLPPRSSSPVPTNLRPIPLVLTPTSHLPKSPSNLLVSTPLTPTAPSLPIVGWSVRNSSLQSHRSGSSASSGCP